MRCIITPGNDDPVDADPVYAADERVEFPTGIVCDLGPVAMASLGVVPFTPWSTERECSEEDLAKLISELLDSVPDGKQCIMNFHCPPYATGLDDAPELDATLKPVIRGVGTRYSDFTTASRTAFGCPQVRFVNVNVAGADADRRPRPWLAGGALVCRSRLAGISRLRGDWAGR